jgi:hypothetical protein
VNISHSDAEYSYTGYSRTKCQDPIVHNTIYDMFFVYLSARQQQQQFSTSEYQNPVPNVEI